MRAIKYYTDEQVARAVVNALRLHNIDVLTVQEADMMGAADEAHLVFATSEGRVIFTQDVDFLRLHAPGVEHFGIVYAPQHSPLGRIIRALVAIHQTLRSEDMQNNVRFI